MTLPSAVSASWWPVSAVIPGEAEPWHRVRAYATPEGLAIYRRRPADGVTPDWFSPIDKETTGGKPTTGWAARNGVPIRTEAGLVILTGGGCGACGHPLANWHPPYATTMVEW